MATLMQAEDVESRAMRMADDPAAFFDYSFTNMHSVPRAELEELQLAALKRRFADLSKSVPILGKLAEREGFSGPETLSGIVPMLFEHTMYKSYPPSLLENNRFDLLTKWLDKLTSHDLSGLDCSGCEGVTDWVELLDEQSPMTISHSSGTKGTMSFNPLSKEEFETFAPCNALSLLQEYGDAPFGSLDAIPRAHVISPTYRQGGNGFVRGSRLLGKYVARSEDWYHSLYPGRLDSDMLLLAGRLNAARALGRPDTVKISPPTQGLPAAETRSAQNELIGLIAELTGSAS